MRIPCLQFPVTLKTHIEHTPDISGDKCASWLASLFIIELSISNTEYDTSTILETNVHESQVKYTFLAEKIILPFTIPGQRCRRKCCSVHLDPGGQTHCAGYWDAAHILGLSTSFWPSERRSTSSAGSSDRPSHSAHRWILQYIWRAGVKKSEKSKAALVFSLKLNYGGSGWWCCKKSKHKRVI